jgi:hypothetical protein
MLKNLETDKTVRAIVAGRPPIPPAYSQPSLRKPFRHRPSHVDRRTDRETVAGGSDRFFAVHRRI